jgi:hypothetical protein
MIKKLKEAITKEYGEDYWNDMEKRIMQNPFFRVVAKHLKEAKLDATDITALGKVYETVLEGLEPAVTRELALTIETDKKSVQFEINSGATAGSMSGGEFPSTGATTTEVTVEADRIKGVAPCWTREYLEDAVWEVLAWQVKEATKAIEKEVMDYMLSTYISSCVTNSYVTTGAGDGFSFTDFASLIASLESRDAHPDVVICHPENYAELLKDDKFISSLYAGDDKVMRSGVVKTTFGVTVIRSSRMPKGLVLALEKSDAEQKSQ